VDLFDRLALEARKYDQLTVPSSGSRTFSLSDVLEMLGQNAILEMTALPASAPKKTLRPDAVRKIKVSLLDDGIVAIHSGSTDQYEVFRTPPSGDLSKVKIVASAPNGSRIGEIRLLMGRRSFEHYFEEDPIFDELRRREGSVDPQAGP
jgi:hypothetical protein